MTITKIKNSVNGFKDQTQLNRQLVSQSVGQQKINIYLILEGQKRENGKSSI